MPHIEYVSWLWLLHIEKDQDLIKQVQWFYNVTYINCARNKTTVQQQTEAIKTSPYSPLRKRRTSSKTFTIIKRLDLICINTHFVHRKVLKYLTLSLHVSLSLCLSPFVSLPPPLSPPFPPLYYA